MGQLFINISTRAIYISQCIDQDNLNPIHQHYSYTMTFNSIKKVVKMEPGCDLKEQKKTKELQGEKAYWEENNSDYLAFVEDDLC